MDSTPVDANRDYWLRKAKQVARQVNTAWWLETLTAPLLIAAIVGAVGLLILRREISPLEPWILVTSVSGGFLLLALFCLVRAIKKFEHPSQSLVRIEIAMRLDNQLSAANAGVASWPAPVAEIHAGLVWQWPRLLVPPVGALLVLASAIWLPISPHHPHASTPHEQPQTWRQLSSELDLLTQEKVVDEKYLEETRKKLDELKSQEEEQWFSHSSLEATDALKKSHRAEAERVEREFRRASDTLANFQELRNAANQAEKTRMMEAFEHALQGLQSGAMKPHPHLLEQMKQLDPKDFSKLTSEQMAQLRDHLQKNAEAMRKSNQGKTQGQAESDEWLADDSNQEGTRLGQGDVSRGPGHDPQWLGKPQDRVETGELTGLSAKDLSRATPGDLLELQNGEHDVDPSASTSSHGGATDATGTGGDRVWRDSLDPAEQRVLKQFFE